MKKFFSLLIIVLLISSCQDANKNLKDGLYAQIETNKGTIITQLDYDKAPKQSLKRSFECDQCGYNCSRSGSLIVHKRIHTKEKPFQCDQCNYKCAQSSHLIIHKRIHTGVKPYECNQCDMKFTQSGTLKVHERIHTK